MLSLCKLVYDGLGFLLLSCAQLLSYVQLFVTPWTAACQAAQSMVFFRQEYWSGLSFPSPRDLPDPGIEPAAPALAGNSLPLSHVGRLLL